MTKRSEFPDPFKEARANKGYGNMDDQDDPVTIILRHKDVRKCAHNWKDYQSGAQPGRIVVPSEVHIRNTRQIPFELDPPEHGAYRALVEDWFKRPLQQAYKDALAEIISITLAEAFSQESIDIVSEFALPLQSRALTLLLNTPYEEASTWISWGTHVFRSEGNPLDGDKASILYDYLDAQIEKAVQEPGEDLYSLLLSAEVEGKKLTHEEIKGVMILTFAGGRDTIINMVTNTIAYLAENPAALQKLREEPAIRRKAVEELIRYFAPLTHMGRVATKGTELCEHAVKENSRISLCWASANRDEKVFENPNEVILDRKMNPHLSFGFGTHKCLGATHARQMLFLLLNQLADKVASIDIIDAKENIENLEEFQRKVGFHHLQVAFKPL
ncbi:MAG: cytochrome P450 [Bacteroidota bacterium]